VRKWRRLSIHWKQQTTLKKHVVCVFLPKKACRNVSALWWSHRCQPRSCCIWSRRRRYHCEQQQQQQPNPVLRCVICARRGSRDQSTYVIFLKNDNNPRIGCQEFPIPSSSRLQWLCQCAEWDLAEIFIFLCLEDVINSVASVTRCCFFLCDRIRYIITCDRLLASAPDQRNEKV